MVPGAVTKLKCRNLWELQDHGAVHAGKAFPFLCISVWLWKFSEKSVHHIKHSSACTDSGDYRDWQSPAQAAMRREQLQQLPKL